MPAFARKVDIQPAEDHGFFGPGSVTWKVWSYPTSLTVGFQRAVVVEELDPELIASVDATGDIFSRPRSRYDRTVKYFATIAFGDTRAATKAADVLVKVHTRGIGVDPVTQRAYDANDPNSQLWILVTAWHSILKSYERFGPGPLSAEEERQYWSQCAVAAQCQTIDPADVPRSREEVRAYFEAWRPKLVGSEAAQEAMAHLLRAEVMLPPHPRVLRPLLKLSAAVLRAGTISTLPHWMRRMGGTPQSRLVDVLVRPLLKGSMWAAQLHPQLELALLQNLSPSTVKVVAPALLGIPAAEEITMTPYEAQDRYGFARPADAHLELRARQTRRAIEQGLLPTDEGLVASEEALGRIRRPAQPVAERPGRTPAPSAA